MEKKTRSRGVSNRPEVLALLRAVKETPQDDDATGAGGLAGGTRRRSAGRIHPCGMQAGAYSQRQFFVGRPDAPPAGPVVGASRALGRVAVRGSGRGRIRAVFLRWQ